MILNIFLILLVISRIQTLDCPLLKRFQSTIFSGNVAIEPQLASSLQNQEIDVPFQSSLGYVPIVALSLNSIQNDATPLIQFNLQVTDLSKYDFTFNVKSEAESQWKTMNVQYLVSTRDDIEFGEAQVFEPHYNYQDVFIVPYKLSTEPTFSTQTIPFLSGLELVSQDKKYIGIKYQKTQTSGKTVRFYFSSFNEDSVVNFLKLSVIAFDTETPGLLHVSDYIQRYSVQKQTQVNIIQNDIQSLKSYLIGFVSFQASVSIPISITTDLSSTFTLTMGPNYNTEIDFLGIYYLAFFVVQCGSCTNFPFSSGGQCMQQCPINTTISHSYCIPKDACYGGYERNRFGQCVPQCGKNAYFKSGHCVCEDEHYLIDGNCQKCQNHEIYNYKKEKCESICGQYATYNQTDTKCYCHEGYYVLFDGKKKYCGRCENDEDYDGNSFSCLGSCDANEQKFNEKCECKNGFHRVKGKCEKCPRGSTFNELFGQCVCENGYEYNAEFNLCVRKTDCGINEIYLYGGCQCKSGFHRIYGKCEQCPKNSFYDKQQGFCQCQIGYSLSSSGQCFKKERCTKQYEKIAEDDGRCICQYGYGRDSENNCVPISINCPQNQTRIGTQCVCEIGFQKEYDGFCYRVQCSPGQYFDKKSKRCVLICPYGQTYQQSTLKCAPSCPTNEYWNGRQCVCLDGYTKNVYNYCTKDCGYGLIREPSGLCKCMIGYKVYLGYCEPAACPQGEIYDPNVKKCVVRCKEDKQIWANNRCVCISGYEFNQYQQCESKCPTNQTRQYGICRCIPGYQIINGNCQINPCLENQIWDERSRSCVQKCPINSYWEAYKCVCKPGYVRNRRNQCVKQCGKNQELNQYGNCACKPYFQRINNICQPIVCPTGQEYDLNLKTCIKKCTRAYEKWQGQICVCIDGYEYYGPNCVPKCGQNQVRKNGLCVCELGYIKNHLGNCVSPYCEAGQIRNNRNQCVDLCKKANEKWNSFQRKCVCETGYYRDKNQNCIAYQCPPGSQRNRYGACIDICQRANEKWDPTKNRCECEENYVRDAFQKCIITCPSGQRSNVQNKCVDICPNRFEEWKSTLGRCVCLDGYGRDRTGSCVRLCIKAYEIWSASEKKCVCKDGFIRNTDTGFCQLDNCEPNERKVNGRCICKSGYSKIGGVCQPYNSNCTNGSTFNPSTNQCICSLPLLWIYGSCKTYPSCPSNSYYNGVKCACNYGYREGTSSNTIQRTTCRRVSKDYKCPSYSVYNGISCFCISGYYPINGTTCGKCPKGTSWNGAACTQSRTCTNGFKWDQGSGGCILKTQCKSTEQWDGLNCRCKRNYYWINNSCKKCSTNTFYDGKSCVNKSLLGRRCLGPYQFWNGRDCVCIPGFIKTKEGCIRCPSYMRWNGYYCAIVSTQAAQNALSTNSNTIIAKIVSV